MNSSWRTFKTTLPRSERNFLNTRTKSTKCSTIIVHWRQWWESLNWKTNKRKSFRGSTITAWCLTKTSSTTSSQSMWKKYRAPTLFRSVTIKLTKIKTKVKKEPSWMNFKTSSTNKEGLAEYISSMQADNQLTKF